MEENVSRDWIHWENCEESDRLLIEQAEASQELAWSPYSKFKVGAAIRLMDGTVFTGANYESASYGLTLCAERAALLRVQAEGKIPEIEAIAITARGEMGSSDLPIVPCGACRQWLVEAAARGTGDMKVFCVSPDRSKVWRTSTRFLLPEAFIG